MKGLDQQEVDGGVIGSSDLAGDIVHSENWDAAESADDEEVVVQPRSARS